MKIVSLLIILAFFSCKKAEIQNAEITEFDKIDSLYFKSFNSESSKFSLLIFGNGYFDSKLDIENCGNLRAEDSLKTLKFGPFAKIYRIENSCNIEIKDLKRKSVIEISTDTIRKYKFIYIERQMETDSLVIGYKKTHQQVK